jgi:hypothetical protein
VKYAILIYHDEDTPNPSDEDMEAWGAYTQEVAEKGLMQAGEALQPTATATSVRLQNGQLMTTDGPFAETKEQLGGFYILDCKDLDEAIEYAGKIPSVPYGTVEVRPVIEFEM